MARRRTILEQIERRLELEAIAVGRRTRAQARELDTLDARRCRRLSRIGARIAFTKQKLARLRAIERGEVEP